MAYPASGFESLYRNPINEVAQFFQENHDINYLVINLSGRKYDYSKFNKMVNKLKNLC
jgi:phosphatidylinositol-3,4,5-trisphosphate 3-phosphatase/dual-specificity protein phosphatase PTEN